MAMFSLRSSLPRRASSSCSWASCEGQVLQMNSLKNDVGFHWRVLKSELKVHHTLRCPWRPLSCFWASDACLLAWLSWISISLRSPSIFFFSLRASFLLRVSDSSELCKVSTVLCWFLLACSISSSFSVSLRSISAFTWLNSSWALKIFPSSCSSEPFQCETVFLSFKSFVQIQPYVNKKINDNLRLPQPPPRLSGSLLFPAPVAF